MPRKTVSFDEPLELDCGRVLPRHEVGFETYGKLAADKSNAVLVFHGLIGDAHAAGRHSEVDEFDGWWDGMIGPVRPLDTDRYFVICANLLGGCGGSTGPASVNPETGRPYALTFPVLTLADMVRAQKRLIDALGIERLHAVIGPSTGAMLALQWTLSFPGSCQRAALIAGTARLSPQSLAFNYAMRQAVLNDPFFNGGEYYDQTQKPKSGLALAFSLGVLAWMTQDSLTAKFGRRTRGEAGPGFGFDPEFEVEHFFDYRGRVFAGEYDPNSLLYATRAIDYFDPARGHASLTEALAGVDARFLLVSYDSDWRYPTHESREIEAALKSNGTPVRLVELSNPSGHASFLRHTEQLGEVVAPFLEA